YQTSEIGCYSFGKQQVIRIQEYQVLSGSLGDASISGSGQPLIGLADIADPRIAAGNKRGIVGGSIVYHDHFHVWMLLVQHTFDGFGQVMPVIKAGNNHRHRNSSYVVGRIHERSMDASAGRWRFRR